MRPMQIFLLAIISLALFGQGCEYDKPTAIWDENQAGAPAPKINRVEPEGFGFSGYTEIALIGENFALVPEQNVVYFNKQKAQVLSATATKLMVKAPILAADSIMIQVVVPGALMPGKFSPYSLVNISTEYGEFGTLDQVYSIALDAEENFYAHLKGNNIEKVTADGKRSVLAPTNITVTTTMRVAPGGKLLVQKLFSTDLNQIALSGGALSVYAKIPKAGAFFDLDENGNLYIGGTRTGLYAVKTDASNTLVGDYGDFDIKSVRVFQSHVYIAATYLGRDASVAKNAIWRNAIQSAQAELGARELVLDWTNTGAFSSAKFFDITFSADGDLLVATDYVDPILVLRTDGSMVPLYPGVLVGPFSHIEWGNGKYLYANRKSNDAQLRRVLRIIMTKNGAPYYGRKS